MGDSTNIPSKLNNFVTDISYSLKIGKDIEFVFGGSYLHGSAFCIEFPVIHFEPCKENNPSWTGYGRLLVKDRIIIKGGFAKTVNVWPGTHNPTYPLDLFEASTVSSKDVGVKYTFKSNSEIKHSLSAEFSDFVAGPSDAPWERQNQFVIGYSAFIKNSSKLFLELFRTNGYVPLNWISGSDPFEPFPPGETHSVRDAFSHGIVIGSQITF